jgi:DNA replication protein DnaC
MTNRPNPQEDPMPAAATADRLDRAVTDPDAFLARIRAAGAIHTYDEHDGEPGWDKLSEHQAQVRRNAWHRDLEENNTGDLAAWTLDMIDPVRAEAIRGFIKALGPNARKRNLILAGNVGNGKTAAAIGAGHEAIARGYMARIVSHARYLSMLRPDGLPTGKTAESIRALYRRHTDVLILDDLGAEVDTDREATEFVRRETNELLGDRLNAGLSTIVTTNLRSDTLSVMFGDRIMSRLGAEGFVLRFEGEDHRKPVTW